MNTSRALAALLASVAALPAFAQTTYDWSGATSGNMSGTPANWGGTIPTSADIARWNAASYTTAPTANANMTIGQLLFDAGNTGGVTFGSGAFTLTLNGVSGAGIQMNSGSGAVSTGSAKFALGAAQSWTNNSASLLTVGGTIATGGFNLTIDGSGNTTLGGIISGTGGIVKSGAGTLTLNGVNTFTTGGVSLSAGTLMLGNATSLGASATSVLTITGGTIDVSATRTTNNAQNWNGDFTFAGSNAWTTGTGAVTLGGNRQVTVSASTMTVSGVIDDGINSYSLTKTGNGTLTLTAANTFGGGLSITGGTANINNAGALGTGALTIGSGTTINNSTAGAIVNSNNNALNWNGSFTFTGTQSLDLGTGNVTLAAPLTVTTTANTLAFGGTISGGTIFDITKAGAGTLLYNGNTTITGAQTANVTGGTLALTGNITGGHAITVNGAGALSFRGATANASASALTANSGSSLAFDSSTDGVTGTTRAASVNLKGATLNVLGNNTTDSVDTITGALTANAPSTFGSAGANTVTLTAQSGANARLSAGSLVRSNNGVIFFRGTNLGANTISSATDGTSNIEFTTAPSAQLVGGGGTAGTQNISILPWAVGATTANGVPTGFVTYDANGIRVLSSGEYDTTISTGVSTNNIKLDGTSLSTNGAVLLTVNGAATVNSLFLTNGTISGSSTSSTILAGTGALTVTSGAIYIDFANGGNNNSTVISKAIDFGTAQGVIGTSGTSNSKNLSFSGGISGSGGVTIYDAGNTATSTQAGVSFGAANSYTGDTVINGSLLVGNANALPNFTNASRTGDVYVNGTLGLTTTARMNGLFGNGRILTPFSTAGGLIVGDRDATSTFSGTITQTTGALSLTKIGTGTLNLTGTTSAYASTTTIQNGTLSAVTLNSVNGGTPLLASSSLGRPITIANGTIGLGATTTTGTLKVTGTGETTDRVINLAGTTGGGGIEQAGTGLLKFTSDFTATGNGLKTLTLSGSTAGTGEISGAIVNSTAATSVTKSGTGTWTLSGANLYSGATTIDGGTLALGANNAFSVNSAIDLNTGGTLDLKSFSTSVASLDFAAGSTLKFNLGTSGNVTALLALTNTLAKTSTGMFTLDFSGSGEVGTYTLLSFSSTAFTNQNEFTIANLGSGLTGTLALNGTSLSLVVSSIPEPSTFALLAGAAGLLFVVGRRNRRAA